MTDEPTPDMMGLIEAGFTPEELRAIARELMFAVQMGTDFHQNMHLSLEDAVEWTPEKRSAFDAALRDFRGNRDAD